MKKSPPQTMIEQESFDEEEITLKEQKYEPKHPQIAFMAEKAAKIKPDHLENYIEVDPFGHK